MKRNYIAAMLKTSTALCIREVETLFRPFVDRKLSLASRIVMAPMNRHLAPDGIPTSEMAMYYRRRAEREVGLIITESATIDDEASSDDSCKPQFYGGAALRGWKLICRLVHATRCKIVPQLCHVGMRRPLSGDFPHPQAMAIGPSGINPFTLEQEGEEMSRRRIADVCASFARAAWLAAQIGFDGVEIQGGYGYLIDQFFRKETNHRRDIYGGDIVGRSRFACEVIHAVRKAVGSQFPILFRISQSNEGQPGARLADSPHELSELLRALCAAGVDIFDCSEHHYAEPAFVGNPLTMAAWVRLLTNKPVISGGGAAANVSESVRMVRAGEVDLIAVGRALLADAAWAEKMHHARESDIIPYTLRSLSRLY